MKKKLVGHFLHVMQNVSLFSVDMTPIDFIIGVTLKNIFKTMNLKYQFAVDLVENYG